MGIFFIGSPSVHVEFHGGEGFPLEIADVDRGIFPAEDAVHVRTDVRLAGEAGADVGRNMETDVFPRSARLVARPDAGITLGPGPAVQGDDERAAVVPVIGHDLGNIRNAVQAEGIAGSDPGDVRFQYAHPGIPDFLDDVTLQKGAYLRFGVQVRLGPQAYFHPVFQSVVCQAFQVCNVPVQSIRLSVPGAVAVVREEPAQRHVMGLVTVDHGAGGKLVVVQLSVQGFPDSPVVLLAFLVSLAVFKQDAFFIFLPVVPVVGIQMTLVEGEFGQQHGISRQLVKLSQQVDRSVVNHEEDIQIVFIMAEIDGAFFFGAKVILPLLERMPQKAVAVRGPVEGSGGGYASVRPTVLVFNGNYFSLVREAAVLHASSVEVFLRPRFQGQGGFAFFKEDGSRLLNSHGFGFQVNDFDEGSLLVNFHPDFSRGDRDRIPFGADIQSGNGLPGLVDQYFSFGLRLRIPDNSSRIVAEKAEDVVPVKVEGHPVVFPEQHLDC